MALITAIAALAMQAEPTPAAMVALTPTSRWRIDQTIGCTISRDYDREGDPVTIGFRLWPTRPTLDIMIVRKTTTAISPATFDAVQLKVGAETRPASGWSSYFADDRRVVTLTVLQSKVNDLATMPTLTVNVQGEAPVAVRLEGMKAAMGMLEQCNANALRAMGIAPAEAASVATLAKPINPGWITSDDYPPSALRAEASGWTGIVLRITTEGRADDCQIIEPSGTEELDAASCRLSIRRARFTPATDAAGKPVTSHGFVRIRWSVP